MLSLLGTALPSAVSAQIVTQAGQTFDLDVKATTRQSVAYVSDASKPIQKQTRGQGELKTIEGLQVREIMTGLGEISSLALSKSGDLFVADKKTGRIWRLTDRGLDGIFDGRSQVCGGFKTPSGLTLSGSDTDSETLYIADQNAIWACQLQTNTRSEYVNLRSVTSNPRTSYPLARSPQDGALLMGVTYSIREAGHISKLIRIDPKDKSARVLGQYTDTLHAIASRPQGDVWVAIGNEVRPYSGGSAQKLEGFVAAGSSSTHAIGGLVLPGQYETPTAWPKGLQSHILATQSGPNTVPKGKSGGMNLVAIPTEFGAPLAKLTVLVDGFLNQRGRAAWGRPSAMVMDRRGLYFADAWQGSLWRVHASPSIAPANTSASPSSPQSLGGDGLDEVGIVVKSPSAPAKLTGTKITGSTVQGSSIKQGSQIAVGSYLIRDYEAKKAEEAAAEKTEKDALRETQRKACAASPDAC